MKYLLMFLIYSATAQEKVVFLGDSLTEGYGIDKKSAYPALLKRSLKRRGPANVEIVNAGISGSTTASALSRFQWLLKGNPTVLVLALGANDGLRGVNLTTTKKNLMKVIELAQAKGVKVLLVGMKLPPNYGKKYTREFSDLFFQLAKKYQLPIVPFLLDGVAGVPRYNLADGIHPNEEGHKLMAKNVEKFLMPLLKGAKK